MPELKSSIKIPSCAQNVLEVTIPREIKFSSPPPSWLTGNLFSSGPGTFDMDKGSVKNWFDGLAMTTKMEIGTDSMKITSRHVHTVCYKKAMKAKKPVYIGMGTPPGPDDSKGFFSKLMPFTPNDITDNCIGVISCLDSRYYVVADSQTVYEVNPKTLATVDSLQIHKAFGFNSMSPEIHRDLSNGDTYIIGSTLKPTLHNVIMKMPASAATARSKRLEEKFSVLGSIPARWKFGPTGFRKCFALTENYIVFIEPPVIVNLLKLSATYIKGYRMLDWLDWLPGDKTRFVLMSKATGKLLKTEYYSTEAFILVDILNAYEEDNRVVLDICTQPNLSIFEGTNLSNMRSQISPKTYVPGVMERFVLPIIPDLKKIPDNSYLFGGGNNGESKAKAMRKGDRVILGPEAISSNCRGYDMGVINPNYLSRKHTYTYVLPCYTSTLSKACQISHGISKVCLATGRKVVWEAGAWYHPWKPVFVPNPNPKEPGKEDDGVLLTIVTHLQKKHCDYFVVIDAETMKEVSRVEFKDVPVGPWYQASYFPS